MKLLLLIRGLPGAGKTTLAQALVRQGLFDRFYEADQFFERGGVYNFNPLLLSKAHEICQKNTEQAMLNNENVIVSNTFTRKWEMSAYLDLTEKHGYHIQVITLEGPFESIHNVPEESLNKMKGRFEK